MPRARQRAWASWVVRGVTSVFRALACVVFADLVVHISAGSASAVVRELFAGEQCPPNDLQTCTLLVTKPGASNALEHLTFVCETYKFQNGINTHFLKMLPLCTMNFVGNITACCAASDTLTDEGLSVEFDEPVTIASYEGPQ